MRAPADIIPPPSLAKRPVDHRGFPIPYVQGLHDDGTPDFVAIDVRKVMDALYQRLCGLCGEELGYWICFIGGPISAMTGHYHDPPMHEACATYALRVCPYLALPATARARRTDLAMNPTASAAKPVAMVLVITRGYNVHRLKDAPGYMILSRSQKEVRAYPFGGDGSYYNPNRELLAKMAEESASA